MHHAWNGKKLVLIEIPKSSSLTGEQEQMMQTTISLPSKLTCGVEWPRRACVPGISKQSEQAKEEAGSVVKLERTSGLMP